MWAQEKAKMLEEKPQNILLLVQGAVNKDEGWS